MTYIDSEGDLVPDEALLGKNKNQKDEEHGGEGGGERGSGKGAGRVS